MNHQTFDLIRHVKTSPAVEGVPDFFRIPNPEVAVKQAAAVTRHYNSENSCIRRAFCSPAPYAVITAGLIFAPMGICIEPIPSLWIPEDHKEAWTIFNRLGGKMQPYVDNREAYEMLLDYGETARDALVEKLRQISDVEESDSEIIPIVGHGVLSNFTAYAMSRGLDDEERDGDDRLLKIDLVETGWVRLHFQNLEYQGAEDFNS